jgi:uncharacterized protein
MPFQDELIKILFAGPVGAGKTTAIRALSDVEPISTEVSMSESAIENKLTTTVAFDYSTIRLDADTTVHLYGLPGQNRLDFMRPIVADGAMGAVILLDASSPSLQEDCTYWISSLQSINEDMPLAFGVSKTDIGSGFSLGELRETVRKAGIEAPIMTIDPRDAKQSEQLIRALLVTC